MLSAAATEVLAICVLATAAMAVGVLALLAARRTALTPMQAALIALGHAVARTLWRAQISGPLPIPRGQGAVIVCNHRCPLDPALIGLTVDRMVHWMVAKEYYANPVLAWFFHTCQSIPVSRSGIDTAATKLAIRYAREGDLVGIFPEGRINDTGRLLLPGRPGAAMIALKARVPVVPCYVEGSPYDGTAWGCLLMPAKVRLKVGRPIDLAPYYGREDDREVLEFLTKRFLAEIAALAGQPDFVPQLAGRFYRPDLLGQ